MNYNPWRIASGYRAQSGRSMWRVIRTEIGNEHRFDELKGEGGKLALFGSYETAQRRADKLNKA